MEADPAAGLYLEDIADQDEMQRFADERMSDAEFAEEGFLISARPGRAQCAASAGSPRSAPP